MTPRVREILSWYGADNIGVLTNLARILNQGLLKGTGKLGLLSVDQGLSEGPAQSFAVNPDGYDPAYHLELALEAGCSAYVAPLGALEAVARDYAGELPLILKTSFDFGSGNSNFGESQFYIEAAHRLGCVGISLTINAAPVASHSTESNRVESGSPSRWPWVQNKTLMALAHEARKAGLVVVANQSTELLSSLSAEKFYGLDQVALFAHAAVQLGAHVVVAKTPSAAISEERVQKIYRDQGIKTSSLAERTRHIMQSAFNGKRVVIFSETSPLAKEELLQEARELARGGAFGAQLGSVAFQKAKKEGTLLLREIMSTYVGDL